MNYKALKVGWLDTAAINRILGLELEAADLWVSKAAHQHIAEDHPQDYKVVMPNLGATVQAPAYVGQKPGNSNNFYLVRRVQEASGAVLVAVGIERNKHGTYNVRSSYLISDEDIQRYREAGHLHVI
ncbi:hypothetical protein [Maricaulis sp.]|uniref:PBECR3 domain-containing polyvalent protein n=1 Tax=Maricaulis sp. TaxID=1486257 RepID=UPI003297DFC6